MAKKKTAEPAQVTTEKTVYNYHAATGAFICSGKAQPSPLEPGEFLIPANSTETPPIDPKPGFVVCFKNGDWQHVSEEMVNAILQMPKNGREKQNEEMAALALRNKLLKDSDWTQLSDTPMATAKRIEWGNYRQQLRDLPKQKGWPNKVEWPQKPMK